MAKKPLNTPIKSPTPPSRDQGSVKALPSLADRALFSPTPKMRAIKAKFWNRHSSGPFSDLSGVSLAKATEVTGSSSLRAWWSKDGFKEWFLNQDEAREETEAMYLEALNAVKNDVLFNPDANANAKVNLLKLLGELTGRLNKNKVEKYLDEDINKMDERQLRAYLKKTGIVLREEKVINVEETSSAEKDSGEDWLRDDTPTKQSSEQD